MRGGADAILLAPPIAAPAGHRRFVNDPDSTADAEKFERVAFLQFLNQRRHFLDRFGEWGRVGDLRADVHLDAADGDVRHGGGALVDFGDAIEGDAEFIFAPAGRDVAVRSGVDIGIDAQGDRRAHSFSTRDAIDVGELPFALDVEAQDALLERVFDLFLRFAHAR